MRRLSTLSPLRIQASFSNLRLRPPTTSSTDSHLSLWAQAPCGNLRLIWRSPSNSSLTLSPSILLLSPLILILRREVVMVGCRLVSIVWKRVAKVVQSLIKSCLLQLMVLSKNFLKNFLTLHKWVLTSYCFRLWIHLLVCNQVLQCQVEELLPSHLLLLSCHLIQNALNQYLFLALSRLWGTQTNLFFLFFRVSHRSGSLSVIWRMEISFCISIPTILRTQSL